MIIWDVKPIPTTLPSVQKHCRTDDYPTQVNFDFVITPDDELNNTLKLPVSLVYRTTLKGSLDEEENSFDLTLDAPYIVQGNKIIAAAGRPRPLEGLRIVVDAGNGAGGFFTRKVLEPLGADTTGSRYLSPDGRFPNHAPNPESPEAMVSIRDAVLENRADFGIIFDTDVDRAGAVLSSGEELNRNRLIAMIAAILLREHPGTTIVTDSITSTGLAAFIRERGGVHRRFPGATET